MSEIPIDPVALRELSERAHSGTGVSVGAWEAIKHPTRPGWWAVVGGRHGDRLVAETAEQVVAEFIAAADPQAVRSLLGSQRNACVKCSQPLRGGPFAICDGVPYCIEHAPEEVE